MSNVPNFKKFVIESDDDAAELRSMGFKSDLPFDERLSQVFDAWYDDPEVKAAIQTLQQKSEKYLEDKGIDFDDPEDSAEWEKRVEWVYNDGIDNVGWFEFVSMIAI